MNIDQLSIAKKVELAFQANPDYFFTEHDIHSELYSMLKQELTELGLEKVRTRDGALTSLVHHEYPTPFRCDMAKKKFRIVKEEDDEGSKSGGKFRRGHYDLVVFNPEFVANNDYKVVTGKNYQTMRQILREIRSPILDLIIEVVFFPSVAKTPIDAADIVNQDYRKLITTLSYPPDSKVKFCKEGLMLVFTNHKFSEPQKLERQLNEISQKETPLFLVKPILR